MKQRFTSASPTYDMYEQSNLCKTISQHARIMRSFYSLSSSFDFVAYSGSPMTGDAMPAHPLPSNAKSSPSPLAETPRVWRVVSVEERFNLLLSFRFRQFRRVSLFVELGSEFYEPLRIDGENISHVLFCG